MPGFVPGSAVGMAELCPFPMVCKRGTELDMPGPVHRNQDEPRGTRVQLESITSMTPTSPWCRGCMSQSGFRKPWRFDCEQAPLAVKLAREMGLGVPD